MRHHLVALFALGTSLVPSALLAADTAPAHPAFAYTPFPAIPVAIVSGSTFAKDLPHACDKLASAKDIAATRVGDGDHAQELAAQLQGTCRRLQGRPDDFAKEDLDLLRRVRDQPGLLTMAVHWVEKETLARPEGKGASGDVPPAPSLGTLGDQAIRGLAEFLVNRAQQQTLRYLRKQLTSHLCNGDGSNGAKSATSEKQESLALRKAVFENVCSALGDLDDGTSLAAIGTTLRAAAERDLRKLPDLGLAYAAHRNPQAASAAFAGRLGLAYFAAVRRGRDPFEVLYSLGQLDLQGCEAGPCQRISRTVRLASAMAYALRQGGEEWQEAVDPRRLSGKQRPVVALAVVLLAEQRLGELGQNGQIGLDLDAPLARRVLTTPSKVLADAVAMVRAWSTLRSRLDNAAESVRRDLLAEGMLDSVAAFGSLVEAFDEVLGGTQPPLAGDAAACVRTAAQIAADLAQRKYGEATLAALAEIRKLASPPAGQMQAQTEKPAFAPSKYLPLLVEIASAQSSSEVAAAFDAYAAPLDTYERKYRGGMIALNGFVGAMLGRERMDSQGLGGTAWMSAAFAPVGVHASYPVWHWLHAGVLLSVLDLGALTSFRLDGAHPDGNLAGAAGSGSQPEAASAPNIGLSHVFSPGAYAVFGLGGSPFVLGLGASYAPELRAVTQGSLRTDVSVLRYGAFLAVDIPLLPFN
jgi:hypothetical protein